MAADLLDARVGEVEQEQEQQGRAPARRRLGPRRALRNKLPFNSTHSKGPQTRTTPRTDTENGKERHTSPEQRREAGSCGSEGVLYP